MSERENNTSPEPTPPPHSMREPSGVELAQTLFQSAKNRDWFTFGLLAAYSSFRLAALTRETRVTHSSPHGSVYEASFASSDPITASPEHALIPEIALSPAQQTRLTTYEHVLRRAQENQLKLLKGETWRFNILDENHNGLLDENKKMMHVPITQDMVDGWYMLAKRIGEGLAQSPQAAHKVEQIRGKLNMEKQAAFQAQEQAAVTSAETILMDAKEATRQSAAETIKIQTLWEHSNENF